MSTLATTPVSSGFDLRRFAGRHFRAGLAYLVLMIMVSINIGLNPNFFAKTQLTPTLNNGMTLAYAGMAQTAVVITGGIDLSVGPMISLSNSLASAIFVDTPFGIIGTVVLVLAVGALCGLVNGLIVVYGRLQPIIVTIITASIYSGIALYIRPTPGGFVPRPYADLLTGRTFDIIPNSLILLILVVLFVWYPFRRSRIGMWVYAIGNNEGAAYMSGVPVKRAKLAAYSLGGLFAGIAGLFLSAETLSGDATAAFGARYTLQSIAAVVLGGTSLFGGAGGVIGTVAGAFALRRIAAILLLARVNPLQQPLWEGIIILIAVALGASRIFTLKNRLDTMR
ncbi:MAG: ABC transporter permease [Burkholderiales bacterium]|nr:ABC transporter permease [Anaerolineae bacterium]